MDEMTIDSDNYTLIDNDTIQNLILPDFKQMMMHPLRKQIIPFHIPMHIKGAQNEFHRIPSNLC